MSKLHNSKPGILELKPVNIDRSSKTEELLKIPEDFRYKAITCLNYNEKRDESLSETAIPETRVQLPS
jgi:hypothetical protein